MLARSGEKELASRNSRGSEGLGRECSVELVERYSILDLRPSTLDYRSAPEAPFMDPSVSTFAPGSPKLGLVTTIREARLKPEFAAEYPGITPDVWMPATELAQKLVQRAHARRREGRYTRTFDPTHFEFRGGLTGTRARGTRTRKTDRVKPSSESAGETEQQQEL